MSTDAGETRPEPEANTTPGETPPEPEANTAAAETTRTGISPGVELLILSFVALFLELMLIRWVPSIVRLVSYFANLLLISSFLGLGVGAMVCTRNWDLFRRFPHLLALLMCFLFVASPVELPGGGGELRYFAASTQLVNYAVLIGLFFLNSAVFVALGERIGVLFRSLPPLRAYTWDLSGSLTGTICLGAFSLLFFSPLLGLALVMLLYLRVSARRWRIPNAVVFVLTLSLMAFASEPTALWSPYYYVTVHETSEEDAPLIDEPLADVRTRIDPPVYTVRVNQHYYQPHGTIDPARYTDGRVPDKAEAHTLPFALRPDPRRVLVLGAGGGVDVEAALLAGAEHVDAVEIDPTLIKLSNRFSAAAIYEDPRVSVIIDDARAYLERAPTGYDVVVFPFLDSQALFSSMANIRLDGFVYTVEAMRSAYGLVGDDGVMVVAFYVSGKDWLARKLVGMVREASGVEPVVYGDGGSVVVCVSKGRAIPPLGPGFERFSLVDLGTEPVELATDTWPYLYLARKTIPRDYAIVIGLLLVLTCVVLLALRRGTPFVLEDLHFFFLGVGFLLLQTKSIVDCSLYFGSTWLVTNLVVTGCLLMVLGANAVVIRWPKLPSRPIYAGLFVALLVACFVPRDLILGLPLWGRVAWTLFAVPLPILFAGLVFSTGFQLTERPAARFGANLIGATVGGFSEYLGMAFDSRALSLILIGAYVASAICLRRR